MVTLLLAMNRNCSSDVSRCAPLARQGRIVTASESNIMHLGEHISVDFFCPRGWRRVTHWVRDQCSAGFLVDVFLDHFFLPNMYWKLRYNVDWLTYKVPALLAAGARRVILPRTDAMVAMEKQVQYKGSLLEPRNHPLWLATEESGVEPNRGCHRTHMDNLIENGPFMVYETGCIPTRRVLGTKGGGGLSAAVRGYEVVVAGRYFPERRGPKQYQMWWEKGQYTFEPKRNICGLAKHFLDRMHSMPAQKVKFTGGVGTQFLHELHPTPHNKLGLDLLSGGYGSTVPIAYQRPDTHCALNSVANGIEIPAKTYFSLYELDLGLEGVIHSLRNKLGHLTKVSQCDQDLLAWLFRQSQGVYAVESGTHCFTWDCDRQLLLDSDPRFPYPLPATPENTVAMGVTTVTKAYRLHNLLPPPKLSRNARRHLQKQTVRAN